MSRYIVTIEAGGPPPYVELDIDVDAYSGEEAEALDAYFNNRADSVQTETAEGLLDAAMTDYIEAAEWPNDGVAAFVRDSSWHFDGATRFGEEATYAP